MKRAGCTATRTNGILLFVQLAVTVSLHWSRVGCCDRQTNSGGTTSSCDKCSVWADLPWSTSAPWPAVGWALLGAAGTAGNVGPECFLLPRPVPFFLLPSLENPPARLSRSWQIEVRRLVWFWNMLLPEEPASVHDPVESKQAGSYRRHIFLTEVETFCRIAALGEWRTSKLSKNPTNGPVRISV